VFLDESGAKTNMTRRCGQAPRGQRVVEHAPTGQRHITTKIYALRLDRVDVPLAIEGAMNFVVFRGYVELASVPTLRPGDVVVMDKLSPHKTKGVQEAVEAAGVTLRYLPPLFSRLQPY